VYGGGGANEIEEGNNQDREKQRGRKKNPRKKGEHRVTRRRTRLRRIGSNGMRRKKSHNTMGLGKKSHRRQKLFRKEAKKTNSREVQDLKTRLGVASLSPPHNQDTRSPKEKTQKHSRKTPTSHPDRKQKREGTLQYIQHTRKGVQQTRKDYKAQENC